MKKRVKLIVCLALVCLVWSLGRTTQRVMAAWESANAQTEATLPDHLGALEYNGPQLLFDAILAANQTVGFGLPRRILPSFGGKVPAYEYPKSNPDNTVHQLCVKQSREIHHLITHSTQYYIYALRRIRI